MLVQKKFNGSQNTKKIKEYINIQNILLLLYCKKIFY